MIATYGATRVGQTAASTWRVASPFTRFCDAVQERRKRQKLRSVLCDLSDRELMDFGTTRGEIDHVTSKRGSTRPDYSKRWRSGAVLLVLMLCSPFIPVFAGQARAQCAARDVLQNRLALKEAPSVRKPQNPVGSAADFPVWKKVTVGTFSDSFALRSALDAARCGIGDTAEEILARPAFTLSAAKTDVELFTVSAAELGFQTETAPLAQIYARAQQLGFGLAPAEIGPYLRLQYLDQPIGEFLVIGMEPIKTWQGEPVILTVANGGAGLILIGQDARLDAEIFTGSRILFVRQNNAVPAEAAFVSH